MSEQRTGGRLAIGGPTGRRAGSRQSVLAAKNIIFMTMTLVVMAGVIVRSLLAQHTNNRYFLPAIQ